MCGHSLVVRTPRRGRGNPGSIPGDRFSLWRGSRVAQWSARWAHNPQVVGSKPTSAMILTQVSFANIMDDEGFEPSTFRMQNGRSTTELNAQ